MENLINKYDLQVHFDYESICNFNELIGQEVVDVFYDNDCFQILTKTHFFQIHHEQDCCESVWLDDVVGDPKSMIGNIINMAEESQKEDDDADESATWTFYKLATIKGYIDLTWRGESNGYYSESVDCHKVELN